VGEPRLCDDKWGRVENNGERREEEMTKRKEDEEVRKGKGL
jgi:hypothetical protein